MNIPNIFTLIRFILIPVIGCLLYINNGNLIILSIVLFLFAVWTDWIDGYIARKYKQQTTFGTFMDPLVDKTLILTILFIFVDLSLIPLWMVLLLLFREFLVTGVRQVCSSEGKVVGANWMGKSKFILQSLTVVYLQILLYFQIKNATNIVFNIVVGYYYTLILTVVSLIFAFNFVWWHRKTIFSKI
jgi:CDP-diacylglycerol--glycerol-3-phosphate 3-phosphatidyltransferase